MSAYQHRTLFVGDIKTSFLGSRLGPDLVLLHGRRVWRLRGNNLEAQYRTLAERFHVVAPDMLGWGETDELYSFSDLRHIKSTTLKTPRNGWNHRRFFRRQFQRRSYDPARR
jgi:2-hydroxymuconate-semialdehyde hydrolase